VETSLAVKLLHSLVFFLFLLVRGRPWGAFLDPDLPSAGDSRPCHRVSYQLCPAPPPQTTVHQHRLGCVAVARSCWRKRALARLAAPAACAPKRVWPWYIVHGGSVLVGCGASHARSSAIQKKPNCLFHTHPLGMPTRPVYPSLLTCRPRHSRAALHHLVIRQHCCVTVVVELKLSFILISHPISSLYGSQ